VTASLDGVRVLRCASPRHSKIGSVSLTVSTHADAWSGGRSYTYYDPSAPPSISAASPPYADVRAGGVITVAGNNFAPAGLGDELAEPMGDAERRDGAWCVFAADGGGSLASRVAGESGAWRRASFVDATSLRCAAPSLGELTADLGDLTGGRMSLSVVHRGAKSSGDVTFYVYDAISPPEIVSVQPAFLGTSRPKFAEMILHGANLAPTGSIWCNLVPFSSAAGTLNPDGTVKCVAPPVRTPGQLLLSLGISGDSGTFSAPVPIAAADERRPPTIVSLDPSAVCCRCCCGGAGCRCVVWCQRIAGGGGRRHRHHRPRHKLRAHLDAALPPLGEFGAFVERRGGHVPHAALGDLPGAGGEFAERGLDFRNDRRLSMVGRRAILCVLADSAAVDRILVAEIRRDRRDATRRRGGGILRTAAACTPLPLWRFLGGPFADRRVDLATSRALRRAGGGCDGRGECVALG